MGGQCKTDLGLGNEAEKRKQEAGQAGRGRTISKLQTGFYRPDIRFQDYSVFKFLIIIMLIHVFGIKINVVLMPV